jgi:hypothetical protein
MTKTEVFCECCGTTPGETKSAGQFIQGGFYVGCWVCSERCRKEMLSIGDDSADRNSERQQMGLTNF